MVLSCELTHFARQMAEAGVRSRYPDATEREVFLRTAALHLTRDEMIRAYHWDPQEHGLLSTSDNQSRSCYGCNRQ